MGKAMGQRGRLSDSGPSRIAETVVAILVPPASREEVLGDLHERFTSERQYAFDALCTVPLVILSRIRRVVDPQILLMQAFVSSLSFLGAAWFNDRALLREQWGLLRLAIPAAMLMLGLIAGDTYAKPGPRPALSLVRGPILGVIFALVSQQILRLDHPDLVLPRWILLCGCAMGLLLSTAVRLWFPPVTAHLQGANAPAHWLKADGSAEKSGRSDRVLKGIVLVAIVALAGTWMVAVLRG